MRHLVRLSDWSRTDVATVFALADEYRHGRGPTADGCAVLFFPPSSVRTRVTFERGVSLMGLQPISFPSDTLNKSEALEDVAAYLALWADVLIVRHPDIGVLEGLAAANRIPVVNAMTDSNHPCEVLSDLYTLSQDTDARRLRYLFVGADGNIARAWAELAALVDLDLVQCCPPELRSPGLRWVSDLQAAVTSADVILTDGPGLSQEAPSPFRLTTELLDAAPPGVRLNPCPPFIRGREVTEAAVAHPAFVGHAFKRNLLPVQQAVIAHLLATA